MKTVYIKFHRTFPGDLKSYGPSVIKQLDQLAGGAGKWDMSQFHGIAKIPGTKIRIERHEDGPELVNFVVTQLPNYLSALGSLASAWIAYKALKAPKEQRTVKLRIGKNSFEGPIRNDRDLRNVVATLKGLK